jgi:hypothetical protein
MPWRIGVVRKEARGNFSGFARAIDPIRGRGYAAEDCIRHYRLIHIVVECRFLVIVCMMPRCTAYAVQLENRSGKKQPIYIG